MYVIEGILTWAGQAPKSSGDGSNPRVGIDTGEASRNRREFGYFWGADMTGPVQSRLIDENGVETTKTRFTVLHAPLLDADGEVTGTVDIPEGSRVRALAYWNKRYNGHVITSMELVASVDDPIDLVPVEQAEQVVEVAPFA
jgi:hypothetical protein